MYHPLPPWPILYIYTILVSFVLAAAITPLTIALLRRYDVIDPVTDDKIHKHATPRGGGIAIFLAFAIAVLLPNYRDNPMKGVMAGAFICLLVGALDDFRGGIPATLKFCALLLATSVMAAFGVRFEVFHVFPLDFALTLIWIVGVTSAFNGIDNMDGLASGVAAIVSIMFLLIAAQSYYAAGTETSLSWFGLLAAGLLGANLGFLLYNFNPAKVFMGDAGSFFLGFLLAALGVMGEWAPQPVIAITIPVLILAIPIFDFAYILIKRVLDGDTRTLISVIEHCAPDHLSHRLVWIGFTQRNAVLIIYAMCFVLGITGILLHNSTSAADSVYGLVQGAGLVGIVVMLMRTAERRQAATQREAAHLRHEVQRVSERTTQRTSPDDEAAAVHHQVKGFNEEVARATTALSPADLSDRLLNKSA